MMKQFENVAAAPRSVEAEQAVLGGLMLVNEQWDNVAEILSEADFSESVHRVIYREMALLVKRNSPIDLITLSDSLRGRGLEQACGGFGYIAEMSKNTPSAANILAYAELVRETAIKREILAVMNEVATETTQPRGRSATELLDLAERKVMGISEIRAKSQSGPSRIDDILGSTIDRLDHLFKTPHDGVTGLDTGYTDLNKKTAGLQNSDLIVIAARPSMGKTTFAMNICENVANNQDKPVLIFSLEMPKDQLMMRILASLGRVDQTRIRTGMLDDDDWHRISATSSVILERNNIFIRTSQPCQKTAQRVRRA